MPVTASISSPGRRAWWEWTSPRTASPRSSRSCRRRMMEEPAPRRLRRERSRCQPVRTARALTMQRARVAILVVLSVLSVVYAARASAQATSADQTIRLSQRQLYRQPRSAAAYFRLGDAYIQKARQTGDLSYVTLAEQALRKSLELTPGNAGATRHLAYVFASRHEFGEAAALARSAIELDPSDGHAHGVLGDALLELGKYEEAAGAFQTMMSLDESLYSLARLSGLKSLRGDPQSAIADLRQAIDAGRASGQPRESVAWAQWQLGAEHFGVGNLQGAETQYLEALTT